LIVKVWLKSITKWKLFYDLSIKKEFGHFFVDIVREYIYSTIQYPKLRFQQVKISESGNGPLADGD